MPAGVSIPVFCHSNRIKGKTLDEWQICSKSQSQSSFLFEEYSKHRESSNHVYLADSSRFPSVGNASEKQIVELGVIEQEEHCGNYGGTAKFHC